jgi:nickel superoxide dismutase
MPCGIYHDDMVYDRIDQYVETMVKGMSILKKNEFATADESNRFVRWVIQKEQASDETAQLLLTYFLQQKIKPGEADTQARLESAHKLLFLLVAIKQNTDVSIVDQFSEEWDKFKNMFHVEGYECKIEALKEKKRLKASELFKELDKEKSAQKLKEDKKQTTSESR